MLETWAYLRYTIRHHNLRKSCYTSFACALCWKKRLPKLDGGMRAYGVFDDSEVQSVYVDKAMNGMISGHNGSKVTYHIRFTTKVLSIFLTSYSAT